MINIVKFIVLVIITFLMCRIITNKRNGLAILGTLLICFSTAILEYMNAQLLEALIFGQGIVILINEFLHNKTITRYLALAGVTLCTSGFLILSNISWQISIGTVLLSLIVWFLIKNRKEIKVIDVVDLVISIIIAAIVSIFFYKYIVMSSKENGSIIYYLTSYFYSYILPFNKEIKFVTHGALTCMISVFPMPLVIALIYMYKNEKHMEFLLPMAVISMVQIMGAAFVSNLVPPYIMAISIALAQIYIMIYFFANVKEKIFGMKTAAYATLAYLVLVAIINVPKEISNRLMLSCMALGTTLECFLLSKYDDVRMQKIAPVVYGIITLVGFIGTLVM